MAEIDKMSGRLAKRNEIAPELQWRTTDLFPDDQAWEQAFGRIDAELPKIEAFRGKLTEDADMLAGCLQLRDKLSLQLQKLAHYAGLKNDEDTSDNVYQGLRDRVSALGVKAGRLLSFLRPEILAIPAEKLQEMIAESDILHQYRHYLNDLLREKAHVLPAGEEALLALSGEVARIPYNTFSMFNNADIKFPPIENEQGEMVELTKARYARFMESRQRPVREAAYRSMYGTYSGWTNTLAANLSGAVKTNIFYARARNYPSALHASLSNDNIPVSVYDTVVNTIADEIAPLHRYMRFRRNRLKVDTLRPWDLGAPLFSGKDERIPFENARDTILQAMEPLGSTYINDLQQAFKNGWIDIYENQGKRSGAYSWSSYGTHPYILMNYNDTLDHMFTLAHELGHALHSHYTHALQPFHYSSYTIFVAEVASTLNESLLIDYLLKDTSDPRRKFHLLNQYVDQIRGTVYIQALFATFEREIHRRAEAGEPLTADVLSEINRRLYHQFLGDAFEGDSLFDINWCRIPHYYYEFYVYQYATGFAAATTLSQRIIAGDQQARDAYLHFLSRGCSAYSIDLLKDAGVDMTTAIPLKTTAALLNKLVDRLEDLAGEVD